MKINQKFKNNSKTTGITLIALVITIIVLLILAGISIMMLSGDNSILNQAGKSRDNTGEKSTAERVKLAYMAALTEGKGNVSNHLDDELKKEFGNGNYTLASDLSKVTIDGKDYYFDGTVTPGGGGGEKQTVADLRTAAISNGVSALSTTDTTTIIDNKNNEIKVPKGFGIATDSGINVAEGIVIEDATHEGTTKGSQFVWVPVGTITKTDGSTETIALKRYVFNTSGAVDETLSKTEPSDQLKTSASESVYYTEGLKDSTTINTHAKDIAIFISKANSSKGYYIARYEAGISGTTSSTTASTLADGSTSKNSSSAAQIVTKSGVGVWNRINQVNAALVCQNMYNITNDKVTSDLINSYAWDTAIVFIQKCGNNGNDSSKYSIQNGYSSINSSAPQSTGTNKLKYTAEYNSNTLRDTPIEDTQCKIYDMAGNVYEWSTETSSKTISDEWGTLNYACVCRGSSCGGTSECTDLRNWMHTSRVSSIFGFRPILYL